MSAPSAAPLPSVQFTQFSKERGKNACKMFSLNFIDPAAIQKNNNAKINAPNPSLNIQEKINANTKALNALKIVTEFQKSRYKPVTSSGIVIARQLNFVTPFNLYRM